MGPPPPPPPPLSGPPVGLGWLVKAASVVDDIVSCGVVSVAWVSACTRVEAGWVCQAGAESLWVAVNDQETGWVATEQRAWQRCSGGDGARASAMSWARVGWRASGDGSDAAVARTSATGRVVRDCGMPRRLAVNNDDSGVGHAMRTRQAMIRGGCAPRCSLSQARCRWWWLGGGGKWAGDDSDGALGVQSGRGERCKA